MPKVSVIMPVYNTEEEWLREAIESILNQTYKDFEFIIINDGSTNNAEDVILSYKDERIKYFKQENQGIAKTTNRMFDIANGEYIALMDSDDFSEQNRLQIQVEFLNNNNDIAIVGSFYKFMNSEVIVKTPQKVKYFDLLKGNQIANPTVMMRKEILNKFNLKNDEQFKVAHDYEFYSRVIRHVNISNIQEILLHYRVNENSNSHADVEKIERENSLIQNAMIEFLTNDDSLKEKIINLIQPQKNNNTFLENIFSIKNSYNNKHKIITLFGIKIKTKKQKNKKSKIKIVKLSGGLGNQMFQYSFGKALEKTSGDKVLFDKTWFAEAAKTIVGDTGKDATGVSIRAFELYIFKNLKIEYATEEQIKKIKSYKIPKILSKLFGVAKYPNHIIEKNAFIFEKQMFEQNSNKYFEGYFQNENYFKEIRPQLKTWFKLPELKEDDEYNRNLLSKIQNEQNPVFIQVRREDYVNLDWLVSKNYYKNAVKYIQERVENPKFFVFCAEDPEYIKNEFDIGVEYELIGERNKTRETFYENMRLMQACKHGILANSSYCWWAAWLNDYQDKIIIAPSPWINSQDEVICDDWIKIENKGSNDD